MTPFERDLLLLMADMQLERVVRQDSEQGLRLRLLCREIREEDRRREAGLTGDPVAMSAKAKHFVATHRDMQMASKETRMAAAEDWSFAMGLIRDLVAWVDYLGKRPS
jgi:hypothetical protein